MIYIVGIGPGSPEHITPKAIKTIEDSDFVIGFDRAINSISFLNSNVIIIKRLNDLICFIEKEKDKNICIPASGDPCFYGITEFIKKNYSGEIKIISGLSSFQYMMGQIGESWHDCYLGSLHGRQDDFLNKVRKYPKTIWLTDKKNNPSYICELLYKENLNVQVIIGENLSYEDEKITYGFPLKLKDNMYSDLSVVYVKQIS